MGLRGTGEERRSKGIWGFLKAYGRWLLFALGVTAVVYLIHDTGPATIWRTLVAAGAFVPIAMACELGFVSMDVVSLRIMFGEHAKKIPALVWLRSAMMAYGVMALLPAGRAGGEVVRAAALSPYVGAPRAAAGAAVLQGVTLWANTLISIPCYIAVALVSGPFSILSLLVLGNGVATGVVGAGLLFGARLGNIGGWLGKRFKALGSHGAKFDSSLREMPRAPIGPVLSAAMGRVFQATQYGVILLAVGGTLTFGNALVAQAIHLVGAGLGDMVPNQAGITEWTFAVFAELGPTLGLQNAVAQMVSIALIHRIVQFVLASSSLLAGAVWKPGDAEPVEVTEPVAN